MEESNQHPVQCRNGCGFYSNAGTEGLCSVCYKDMIKKKQQPPQGMPASLAPTPGAMASLSLASSASGMTDDNQASSSGQAPTSASPVKASSMYETGSPTVLIPSQTDKRAEATDPEALGAAAAKAADATQDAQAHPSSQDQEQEPKELKKKKNRCLSCKKKVGLTGFTCRCGGLFCSMHRYSDKHECTYDYKEQGAEEIRKSNPVIVAQKVQKI